MKNLVSIEKKKFIIKEYIIAKDILCEYDLVMELLDDSLFEQGDIAELCEVVDYIKWECSIFGLSTNNDVEEAHNEWVENNYNDTLPSW